MSTTASLHKKNETAFFRSDPSCAAGATGDLPEKWICPADGTELRLIPAGEFIMGSTVEQTEAAKRTDRDRPLFALSPETPQFRAHVPEYYIGTYAVTNAQFARFLTDVKPTPKELDLWLASLDHLSRKLRDGAAWRVDPGYENHPVPHVSWHGADVYCQWAGLRLPREIEWEKAARGTDARLFPWGDEWRDDCVQWHREPSTEAAPTVPVDAFPKGGDPRASYALWQDGEITLHRFDYDIHAVTHDLAACVPPKTAIPLAGVLLTGGTFSLGQDL